MRDRGVTSSVARGYSIQKSGRFQRDPYQILPMIELITIGISVVPGTLVESVPESQASDTSVISSAIGDLTGKDISPRPFSPVVHLLYFLGKLRNSFLD